MPSFGFKLLKVVTFGFVPLFAIVFLNVLSIRRLNGRVKRFSLRPNKSRKRIITKGKPNTIQQTQEAFTTTEVMNNDDTANKNTSSNNKKMSASSESLPTVHLVHSITSLRITHKAAEKFLSMRYLSSMLFWSMPNLGQTKRKTMGKTSTTTKRFVDVYTKKNKKAVSCILAITVSIILTQILYLISWPIYEHVNNAYYNNFVAFLYVLAVWLSYLTSLLNPILLCLFNGKVKSHSKAMLKAIFMK